MPASASVSSHAGHSLKAALGTITFLCHRFVQYLCLLYRWMDELSMTNLTWFAEKMHKFSCTLTAAAPRSKRIDTKRVSASVFRFRRMQPVKNAMRAS